jgi:heme a synthase
VSLVSTVTSRLPVMPLRWARGILVANLVAEIGIVVTGGVVRLTGSGLGCPTWPECMPGSFTPVRTDESSIHDLVEFGNRLLTFVVVILAFASLYSVLTQWPRRGRLQLVALGVLAGIPAQAILGGITVLTGLNPYLVAGHFLLSMVLVILSTALVRGSRDDVSGPGELLVHPIARVVALVTCLVGGVVVVLGTIVTGSGPHSGDADTPARTGFDPRVVSWLHADMVMLFCGLVVATLVAVLLTARADEARRAWWVVLGVTLAQGVIGYVQYFTALPVVLVLLHMIGASLLVAALTWGVLSMRRHPV